jgi:3-oxoacyl-[acyl-carrier-protein] synthase II
MKSRGLSVAVTGIGMVTPLGYTFESVWDRLLRQQHAFAPVRWTASGLVAAEVVDFDASDHVPSPKALKYVNRSTALVLAAAHSAWLDSGIELHADMRQRVGIYVGAGEAEVKPEYIFPALGASISDDGRVDRSRLCLGLVDTLHPHVSLLSLSNSAVCYTSIAYGIHGISCNFVKSGIGGLQAIGEAARAVSDGYADAVLVMGHDCLTDKWTLLSYDAAGFIASGGGSVTGISCPFDACRNGFMAGEGAGALLLEHPDMASSRGAHIYGFVSGYGQTADGCHPLGHAETGSGLSRAIGECLDEAESSPGSVDLVYTHGDGTIAGDISECDGLVDALGQDALTIPATATKQLTGHMGAASGTVEAIFALLMMKYGTAIPVAFLKHTDDRCPLNLLSGLPVGMDLDVVLKISRGFAGQNAVLAIESANSSRRS